MLKGKALKVWGSGLTLKPQLKNVVFISLYSIFITIYSPSYCSFMVIWLQTGKGYSLVIYLVTASSSQKSAHTCPTRPLLCLPLCLICLEDLPPRAQFANYPTKMIPHSSSISWYYHPSPHDSVYFCCPLPIFSVWIFIFTLFTVPLSHLTPALSIPWVGLENSWTQFIICWIVGLSHHIQLNLFICSFYSVCFLNKSPYFCFTSAW